MEEELQKAQEELKKQSEQYAEEKKKQEQEKMQKKVDMIGEFLQKNNNEDYVKINKIICKLFSNAVEDYIEFEVYSSDHILFAGNNLEGIKMLQNFYKNRAEHLMDFLCGNYLMFFDLPNETVLEINFERR
jgi:hypothetical protein